MPIAYVFPNDATENERLEFQHLILHYIFQEKLYFAPLFNPSHILDIGTGTGAWAIEMGDLFPLAQVEATDLSPIQPTDVPENVHFIIDDAEQPDWVVPADHYDYIHTRVLLGCFQDFKDIVTRGLHHTKPGGYMESQEIMFTTYCDDGTMPADWKFLEWSKHVDNAAMIANRPVRIGNKLKRWYQEAGFEDVQEKVFHVPFGIWPRDPAIKALGRWWLENLLTGLQAFSMAYFTRFLNWTPEEVEVCCLALFLNTKLSIVDGSKVYLINVRKSCDDRNIHAFHKVYVVWGRKPDIVETSESHSQTPAEPSSRQTPSPTSASHPKPAS